MKYKSHFLWLSLVIAVASGALLVRGISTKQSKGIEATSTNGFALIELFTSEGCSSCPAAEAIVKKISGMHRDNLYVLSFHVDYWNRLGWIDKFSSPVYSARQRAYGLHFKLDGVYTPQVVVNGSYQMVGSNEAQLKQSVDTEIKNMVNKDIELSARLANSGTVAVNYKINAPVNTVLNIALVQGESQTNVKAGENEGRTLHHINIVRDLKRSNR